MKRNTFLALCLGVLASAGVYASGSYAGEFAGRHCHAMGGKHEAKWSHIANKLDLTDEQKQLLDKNRQDSKAAMSERKLAKRQMHEEMHALVTADSYDAQKVEQLADKMAADVKTAMLARSESMHQFYATLDDEQKEQLDKMHEKRRKFKGGFRANTN